LMVVTGAMVLMRIVLSGLLQYTRSPRVLFVSIGITAAGGLLLLFAGGYGAALAAAAALIGAGLAAAFPVVLGYIGDRYPAQSGTAFSAIFFIALIGNMTSPKPRHPAISQSHARLPAGFADPSFSRRQTTPGPDRPGGGSGNNSLLNTITC